MRASQLPLPPRALLEAVFEVGWGGFLSRVREVAESDMPLDDKVRRIAQVAFEAYRHDPKAVKVIILEIARRPALEQARRRSELMEVIRVSERMFSEAKRSRQLKPHLDPLLCAAQLFGAIEMVLTTLVLELIDTRSEHALARAQAIVDAFAKTPGGGVVAIDGKMYDRPHLVRAQQLLARAKT